jgi:hypothetical protein
MEALEQTMLSSVVAKTEYFNNIMAAGENIFPLGQSQSHLTGKSSHIHSISIIYALQAHNFRVSQHTESTWNAHIDPHGRVTYGYDGLLNNLLIYC